MAGIISTVTSGVLTGRLHRGVLAKGNLNYIVPGARSEMLPSYVGLVVSVAPGSCVIGGCIVDFPITEQVTITPVSGQKGYIVARLSLTAGTATIMQIQGTAPTITSNSLVNGDTGIRDMILAYYTTSGSAITSFVDRRQIGDDPVEAISCSVAAATANKGAYPGRVVTGKPFYITFSQGNTAASPTITIGNTDYAILNLPTVPMTQSSAWQMYRVVQVEANGGLFFDAFPDYKTEFIDDSIWVGARYATGLAECYAQISAGSQAYSASGAIYVTQDLTFPFPVGLFSSAPKMTGGFVLTTSSYAWLLNQTPTKDDAVYALAKTTSASADLYHSLKYEGKWR